MSEREQSLGSDLECVTVAATAPTRMFAFFLTCLPSCSSLLTTASVRPVRLAAGQRSSRYAKTSAVMVDGGWYMNSLHDHYYLTTAVQACTLVSAGDVFAQLIELRAAQEKEGASQLALADYDPTRTVRMGCLGLFIGGLGTAAWLRQLERALPMRDTHQYSAFSNLPVWAYAPVLRLGGIDQVTLAECAVPPPPSSTPCAAAPPALHPPPTPCAAAPPALSLRGRPPTPPTACVAPPHISHPCAAGRR